MGCKKQQTDSARPKGQRLSGAGASYWRANWQLYVLILPAVAFFLIFSYYPMLGLQIAFKDWNPNLGIWGSHWATDENGALDLLKWFRKIFDDPEVAGKLLNTIRLSSLRLVCSFPIPIIIVVMMNEMRLRRLKKGVQTMIYLPHFVSWVIMSAILQSLTATGGTLQNLFLKIFGQEIHFFADGKLFLVLLIVSDIWKEVGWATIIYLAALSNVDPNVEEAAAIDGAGRWQRIRYIILPALVPAISINLVFACSNLVYGGFDQVFNLYNSAVYSTADILETYLYRIGVSNGHYSLSTALSLFNSLIAFGLMMCANKIVKKIGGSGLW